MLAHISTPEWILSAFILACALWVLAAEFLPGNSDTGDPPDTEGEEPEPIPLAV